MSETNPSRSSPVNLGGGLGIAACFIGLAIFLGACCGFNAIFMLSIIPIALQRRRDCVEHRRPLVQKSVHVERPPVLRGHLSQRLGPSSDR